MLDVVFVGEDERRDLIRHLESHPTEEKHSPFLARQARKVELACSETEYHFDDVSWPNGSKKPARAGSPAARQVKVEFEVLPGALRVMAPVHGDLS